MTKQKSVPLSVGIRRILKLADYVEKIPKNRFDFNVFVGEDWKGDRELSCGTTACALGWATTMPLFSKLGLRLCNSPNRIVIGRRAADWGRIGRFLFGIPREVAEALFSPGPVFFSSYPSLDSEATPRQWAEHARKVVKILRDEAS